MARFLAKLHSLVPRKKTALRIGIGVFAFMVLLAASAEFTSQPTFCTSCHYMEPFYESWLTSSHAEVTCVKCHFPPGIAGTVRGKMEGLVQVVNYVTSSYARRKPWAEIDDTSCLESGCHETRLLQDSVGFFNVTFAHQPHLEDLRRGKKLRCTSCHSQIVQGDHMVVTETSCFLCHFKRSAEVEPETYETLSNCKTCHRNAPGTQPVAFVSGSDQPPRFDHTHVVERNMDCAQCHNNTIIGDGFVPADNCFSCHFEPEHLDRYEDTDFLHAKHITENKIECTQCHLRIQHKIQRLTAEGELDCSTCHTSTHHEQLLLFTGSTQNGVEGVANPMFEAGLDCASCHVFHEQLIGEGSVRSANPQSCESCHGAGYDHLLQLWEESAANKLREYKRSIQRVENGLRSVAAGTSNEVRLLVEQAKAGMHIVEVGRAVHNVAYTDQIIRSGYDNLRQAVTRAGVNVTLPAFEASIVPGECANCHTGVETISRRFNGSVFSHETHVVDRQVECNACHSNARRHGELTVTSESCNTCHHRSPALENCADCHETANAIYAGTFLDADSPDLMFDEDVECVDCHVVNRKVVRPDASICVDCHDDDYEEMGLEWQTDVRTALEEVNTLLRQLENSPELRRTETYRQAQQVVRKIEESGAGGLHNYDLILETLHETKANLALLGSL